MNLKVMNKLKQFILCINRIFQLNNNNNKYSYYNDCIINEIFLYAIDIYILFILFKII